MANTISSPEPDKISHSEVLRSPALYLGEFEVSENSSSRGKRFSATWYKGFLIPLFYWTARHIPLVIAMLPVYLLIGLLRIFYFFPGNSLRQSVDAICKLANQQGYHYQPWRIYMQFLTNLRIIIRNYLLLYRGGIDAVQELIEITPSDVQKIEKLRNEFGGVILNVPHNMGSAFSGFKINLTWPTLIISKNSSTIARTKVQLAFFERMKVKVLMVRGGNPFEMSRTMFTVLKKNTVVPATLDKIDNSENRVEADIFNHKVGFSPWAAKIAVKLQVPQVPVYFKSQGNKIQAVFGEPLVTDNLKEAVQHYISFFEQCIYEDPASWPFLADKEWHRALCKFSQAL